MARCGTASITSLLAFACLWQSAHGMGMRVTPGGAVIQGVRPGEKLEIPLPLTVINDGKQSQTVCFEAVSPSARQMKLPPGYREIPNPSWMTFGAREVAIGAKQHASVKMYVTVPDGPRYFDQHWSVAVAVRTKPAAGEMVSLGLYPRFEIETLPAPATAKGTVRPLGELAISPSTWELEEWKLGDPTLSTKLRLWNNMREAWSGKVIVIADAATAKKHRLALSGQWTWPTDRNWVRTVSSTIQAPADGSAELKLEVTPPKEDRVGGLGWETLVLLQSDDGPAAFARIRLKSLRAGKADQSKP